MNRTVRVAKRKKAVLHLLVAKHGDGKVTTLCADAHVEEQPDGEEDRQLCKHCVNVQREMAEASSK